MMLVRKIREHRPQAILAALVLLSLLSLTTGTEATIVHRGIHRAVEITNRPFLKLKLGLTSTVNAVVGTVAGFHDLKEENQGLRTRTAELQLSLHDYDELQRENGRLRDLAGFVRRQPRFELELVNILENIKGILTIDQGRVHGMETSMCVVSPDGVVGLITEVYDLSAKVATIHHPDCRVGAMVLRNRVRSYDGVLHAGLEQGGWCRMFYIDMKDEVLQGDLVVTSPESLFPAGWPVGVISAPPHNRGSFWQWAEVEPVVDTARLDEVFVVCRALDTEEELAGDFAPALEQAPPLGAPVLSEERPIQERYAP
jgi:rod shape-determining protein MreC